MWLEEKQSSCHARSKLSVQQAAAAAAKVAQAAPPLRKSPLQRPRKPLLSCSPLRRPRRQPTG
jgi:hypothetical protein